MNILASYKWLKEYLKTDLSPEEFARELSLRSMSVESIDKSAEKYANMVVGVIKEVKAHPKADRLRIAVTDVGNQTVEIVCGGSNLEVNHRVFVALPGSKVRWHGEGDLIELKETEIRGVKSVGMICAPIEVGFDKLQGDEHEIWDLTKLTDAAAGTSVVDALGLDDTIFDIEVTTNRPDCMGMVGLAREGAAAIKADFSPPSTTDNRQPTTGTFEVTLNAKKLCPRYMAAVVKNVKVGPSPWWLQLKLLQAGHRPINNIVDITNYVLHELGQPMHAFDADLLKGRKLEVRLAGKGETILALDGVEYKLSAKNLVIADAERPVAIAGVMGGKETGTTAATTTVVFEAATFDAVSIRKTARELNCYSDSQLVFEKGLSTEALPMALARAVELAKELAGGELVSVSDQRLAPYEPQTYPVLYKKMCARIGVEISNEQIDEMLTRLGFVLEKNGNRTVATVPYWRDHDVEAEVDLTEEVARLYGYHLMPLALPSAPPPTYSDDATLLAEGQVKRFLAAAGYSEFFGYSFIDAKTLERYGISPETAVKILNPLSEDLSHLRPTLVPSLLRDIERNQANIPQGKVFELSRVHILREGDLPDERFRLVIAQYGTDDGEKTFRELRGTLEALGERSGLTFNFQLPPFAKAPGGGPKPGEGLSTDERWHPSRQATIAFDAGSGKQTCGTIGQVAPTIQEAFGIGRPVWIVDLDLELLMPHLASKLKYVPVSNFPEVHRDLSVVVKEQAHYHDLADLIKAQNVLITAVELTDIYRGQGVPDGHKSLTISLTFSASERTLTSAEIDELIIQIGHALVGNFGAVLRS